MEQQRRHPGDLEKLKVKAKRERCGYRGMTEDARMDAHQRVCSSTMAPLLTGWRSGTRGAMDLRQRGSSQWLSNVLAAISGNIPWHSQHQA
uniref:Uncharacterized protein n=1 Tax=Oryza rufipogon TaxID=4529 RepID=A0A0E0Q0U8_ORYRU